MDYLNFAIEVNALPDDRYEIAVQSSPVGEARAVARSPFTPAEISDLLAVLGRQQRISREAEIRLVRQFGEKLFTFLIRDHDDINAAYFASLDRANNDGLRLRLSVERAGLLADLPWELLRDPLRDFLALSRSTPIVRYTRQLSIRPPVTVALPLRVLVMIAAPSDHPALDVEDEWQRLQEATAGLQQRGLIELERLDTATLIALQRRLRAEVYHVFHYIGHSDFDPRTQTGVLVLEDETDNSRSRLIDGVALSRELSEESTIRLVLLNSCQSARRAERDPFAGIASSIVAREIPAVVAMQFPISDRAAKVFSEEFYRAISENLPIDSAISEARRAIANRIGNAEWVTPALYMRSSDGQLFRPVVSSAPDETRSPLPRQPMRAPAERSRLPLRLVAGLALVVIAVFVGLALNVFSDSPVATPTAAPILTPTGPGDVIDRPDLQIANIRSAPSSPAPGQVFRLLISIRNAGTVESGAFNWLWDASPLLRGALEGRIDNIPPGASRNISFPYSYGWWGSYSSQIIIDADGEVNEADERDNIEPAILELDPDRPFELDFTLLPDNEIVTPPRSLADRAFLPWNITFTLAAPADDVCADTPFSIIEIDQENVLVPVDAPACAELPLAIILRRPVGGAWVEVLPSAAGEAAVTLFRDALGTEPVFTADPVVLAVGGPVVLGLDERLTDTEIQRIEIDMPGQPVRLSRLVLLPPSN